MNACAEAEVKEVVYLPPKYVFETWRVGIQGAEG